MRAILTRRTRTFCGPNRHWRPAGPVRLAPPGRARLRCPANKQAFPAVTIVSFKSKYIAVAIAAAVLVSLAVGSVMIYENRDQHRALLDIAAADARDRVQHELALRAGDLARHVAGRVAEGVSEGDRERVRAEGDLLQRDETLLALVIRNTAGVELYSWRREIDSKGLITRGAAVPVRTEV